MIAEDTLVRVRSTMLAQFPNLAFAMSTKQSEAVRRVEADGELPGVLLPSELFLAVLGLAPDAVASMEQVHGATITEADEPGVYPATDILVTKTCGLGLAVRVADCVPIVLYAPAHNTIAAIHAGWKGTASHAAAHAVEYLKNEHGIDPDTLFAYLGPAAGQCCYEVQPDVAALFPEHTVVGRGDALHLDLHEANAQQLTNAGLPRANIDVEAFCTVCNPAFFHSHRRDGAAAGRMFAVVAMREEAD